MWTFSDESGKWYYLKNNSPFVIGRINGDLVLSEDGSISRAHASIVVSSGKCILTDTKSKYGTFLLHDNGEIRKIIGDHEVKNGDRIRLGLQRNILTFHNVSFVVLTSSVRSEDREILSRIIEDVDGRILPEWTSECTHLTVSSTKLTAKLSCCLAAGLPIVTTSFWQAVKTARDNGDRLPDPGDFTPSLDDTIFHTDKASLLPNPQRKTVFSNLLFIHFRQNQLEIYRMMIKLAGGRSVLYGSKNFDKKLLSDKNTRLVLYSENNTQEEPYKVPSLTSVQSFVKKLKRRMIPESEIPLAILYSSIENCCNPEFFYESLLKRREKRVYEGETLAADTQDNESDNRVCSSMMIPETGSFVTEASQNPSQIEDIEENWSRKRTRCSGDEAGGDKRARMETFRREEDEEEPRERVFSCIKSRKICEAVGANDGGTEKADDNLERASLIEIDEDSQKVESQKLMNIRRILTGSVDASQRNESSQEEEEAERDIDENLFKKPGQVKTNKAIILDDENDEKYEEDWRRIDGYEKINESRESKSSEGADCSILRPEFFSGKEFGKKFKKFHVQIPEQRIVSWGIGQWT